MEVLVEEMKKGGPVWTPVRVKAKQRQTVTIVIEEEDGVIERSVKYSALRKSSKKNKQYFNCFDHVRACGLT